MIKKFLIFISIFFTFNVFAVQVVDLNNNKVNVEDIVKNTKKGVMEYVAIWCGHCKKEIPKLNEMAKENSDIDVILIFTNYNMDENAIDKIKEYLKEENLYNVKVYYDINSEVLKESNIKVVPVEKLIKGGKEMSKNFIDSETIPYILNKLK